MSFGLKRVLLTLASGSAMAIAPVAFATVLVPVTSHADTCKDSSRSGSQSCGTQAKGLNCPDGTIVDEENKQCVDLTAGIQKQLQALPAPPSLSGFGGLGGGGGGVGGLGAIPSLGTVNLPDVVLPSLGLNLVPNLDVNLQPQLGGLGAAVPNLTQLPAPQLPAVPAINPLNPLGLPPPPDLTPGIPFI